MNPQNLSQDFEDGKRNRQVDSRSRLQFFPNKGYTRQGTSDANQTNQSNEKIYQLKARDAILGLARNVKKILTSLLFLMLGSFLMPAFFANQAKAITITVPNEYPTIQDAVNHASYKDTIILSSGNYIETVDISKALTIIGQGRTNTVIEGLNASGDVDINLNGVTVNKVNCENGTNIWMSGSRVINANIGSNAEVYMTNSDLWHPCLSDGGQILFFGDFLIIGRVVFSFLTVFIVIVLIIAIVGVVVGVVFYRYVKNL